MRTSHPPFVDPIMRRALALILALACVVATLALMPGSVIAQDDRSPPPEVVVLARSDVPADALGAGPVAGVLGAPVLVNPSAFLLDGVADAIQTIDPDLVILAGGEAALSAQVESEVEALGYPTRRAAGADRHETATILAGLLVEFGVGRPVLSQRAVTDEIIPGLNAELLGGLTLDEILDQAGDGEQGPPGPPGQDGQDGQDGEAARPASDATVYVDADSNAFTNGANLVAALDDLPEPSDGRRHVVLGAGVYVAPDLEIPENVVLAGAGVGATTLITVGGGTDPVTITGSDVTLRDLTIRDESTSTSTAITVEPGAVDFLIEAVEIIVDASGSNDRQGIAVLGSSRGEIRDSVVDVSSSTGGEAIGVGLASQGMGPGSVTLAGGTVTIRGSGDGIGLFNHGPVTAAPLQLKVFSAEINSNDLASDTDLNGPIHFAGSFVVGGIDGFVSCSGSYTQVGNSFANLDENCETT